MGRYAIPTLARFAHSQMLRKVNITRTIDIQVGLAIFRVTQLCTPQLNPFTAPACKISGLKDTPCVSVKILSHHSAKNKAETVKRFEFCTFIGRFQVTSWQRKGLMFSPIVVNTVTRTASTEPTVTQQERSIKLRERSCTSLFTQLLGMIYHLVCLLHQHTRELISAQNT